MVVIELAFCFKRLNFHPEPEFHPQAADLFNNRAESVREFADIGIPVSEKCLPAVVDYEQFRSGVGCRTGGTENVFLVDMDVDASPGVEKDRHRFFQNFLRVAEPFLVIVQDPACSAESFRGMPAGEYGSFERFARRKRNRTVKIVDPAGDGEMVE